MENFTQVCKVDHKTMLLQHYLQQNKLEIIQMSINEENG